MSVLTRLAGALLVGGLVAGVVLRLVLTRSRLRSLLLLAMAPWVLHLGYVLVVSLRDGAPPAAAAAYAVAGAVVALGGTYLGYRSAARRPLVTALTPAAVGLVYGLLPFGLYTLELRHRLVDIDIIPTAVYGGACLFASAALLVFAPSPPVREGGRGRGGPPVPRRPR